MPGFMFLVRSHIRTPEQTVAEKARKRRGRGDRKDDGRKRKLGFGAGTQALSEKQAAAAESRMADR